MEVKQGFYVNGSLFIGYHTLVVHGCASDDPYCESNEWFVARYSVTPTNPNVTDTLELLGDPNTILEEKTELGSYAQSVRDFSKAIITEANHELEAYLVEV